MALLDYEGIVLDLERHFLTKNSFGQRELLALVAQLRVDHRQVEGLPEKALRLYGSDLAEAVKQSPAIQGIAGPDDMEPPSLERSGNRPVQGDTQHDPAAVVH